MASKKLRATSGKLATWLATLMICARKIRATNATQDTKDDNNKKRKRWKKNPKERNESNKRTETTCKWKFSFGNGNSGRGCGRQLWEWHLHLYRVRHTARGRPAEGDDKQMRCRGRERVSCGVVHSAPCCLLSDFRVRDNSFNAAAHWLWLPSWLLLPPAWHGNRFVCMCLCDYLLHPFGVVQLLGRQHILATCSIPDWCATPSTDCPATELRHWITSAFPSAFR